ncbi:MAG: hypothetical protein V5A79_00605 [Candidatus Bipolaricaulota bacterium]
MKNKPPGVIETLIGNRKIVFGIISLFLALVLAFFAIHRRVATYSEKGLVEPGGTVGINRRNPNDEGKLSLKFARKDDPNLTEAVMLDYERNILETFTLKPGRDKELNIDSEVSYFKLARDGSTLTYSYVFQYTYQPFRLLSLPAALFTLFGVIAVYRGFNQYMTKFAEEKSRGSEEKGSENEGQHADFMGSDDWNGENP